MKLNCYFFNTVQISLQLIVAIFSRHFACNPKYLCPWKSGPYSIFFDFFDRLKNQLLEDCRIAPEINGKSTDRRWSLCGNLVMGSLAKCGKVFGTIRHRSPLKRWNQVMNSAFSISSTGYILPWGWSGFLRVQREPANDFGSSWKLVFAENG